MCVKVIELFEDRLQQRYEIVTRSQRSELRSINLSHLVPVSLFLIEVSVVVGNTLPKIVKVFFVLLASEVRLWSGNGFSKEAQQDEKC